MTATRLIFPAIRWRDDTGFDHEWESNRQALALGVGGFIIFGGTAEAVRALSARLRGEAGRPLLLAADLERGAGQQFDGLTQFPPPRALTALDRPEVTRWAGEVTAREARSVGINWVFAPVADLDLLPENPIIQTRSFAADPLLAARHVAAWIEGCQAGGALACAKHYPGHARTTADSHLTLPVVSASREQLSVDLVPFRAAMGAGVASLMTAHVSYPALDPSGLPATLSSTIIGELRQGGFDGLVVSDALIMEAALAGRSEADAAVAALVAGVDILLYPQDTAAVAAALAAALASGTLPVARVDEARGRYERALQRAELPLVPQQRAPFDGAPALADALVAAGVTRARLGRLRAPIELLTVDDDLGGPYAPVPGDTVAATLTALGVPLGSGGSRVVLAFAEPRAWKGRAGFGEASRAALKELVPGSDLTVLFGHPRLVGEIPGDGPVLVAWHRQRLMQSAAGRWLSERSR
ncbi:MAG: glycosidase [Gemmatimonadetes bacterium]|jgi:beta-glucosidase|nr:glycosidase [Gemmatimonadota bacterium]